jgi:NADH:ubiquinone oxidoreductase subunit F (NADH-binding)
MGGGGRHAEGPALRVGPARRGAHGRRRPGGGAGELSTTVAAAPTALPWLLGGPPAAAGPEGFDDHLARLGGRPAGGAETIAELRAARLLGRGGASFPAWRKWEAVAGRARGRASVLVNGAEGEPLSWKDRALMASRPHLVLDGAALAAETVEAAEVVLYVNRRFPEAVSALEAALAERRHAERVAFRLVTAPPRYVSGEETAAVRFVNGGEARPTFTPPRPYQQGVRGAPTLVQNVETLGLAAMVARFGGAWLACAGSPGAPGPMLATVSGAVGRPAVYEVPQGASLAGVVELAGGRPDRTPAVLVGGYFGSWVPGWRLASVGLEAESLAAAGARLGCGAIFVLPEGACGLTETSRILSYLAGESARQCGPCHHGLATLALAFDDVATGRARRDGRRDLERWAAQLARGRGACKHPDGAVALLQNALAVFSEDLALHLRHGTCSGSRVHSGLPPAPAQEGWR